MAVKRNKAINLWTVILMLVCVVGVSQSQAGDWTQAPTAQLTAEYARSLAPTERYGNDIRVMPLSSLYTIPKTTVIEHLLALRSRNREESAEVIVLANGIYDLNDIASQVKDPRKFRKHADGSYISYRPILVLPTADLVIQDQELKLSIADIAFILYHGRLFVLDARITSWDEQTADYGARAPTTSQTLTLIRPELARPYLAGINGSESIFVNSRFDGLGYQSDASGYGIAATYKFDSLQFRRFDLIDQIRNFEKPKLLMIGNEVTRCFFGFFSNRAGKVVLLGNSFHDNLIYNLDPHDFTDDMVLSNNVSYRAKKSHGIIISREVNQVEMRGNISFLNGGSGIALDRNSVRGVISENLSFANNGDGISIFESGDNQVSQNWLFANANNGILLRNSNGVTLEENTLVGNAKRGIEVRVTSIDHLETRNFTLDAYNQAAFARVIGNLISHNTVAAIGTKGGAGIFIRNNVLQNSGPLFFSGELEPLATEILKANNAAGYLYCPNREAAPCD